MDILISSVNKALFKVLLPMNIRLFIKRRPSPKTATAKNMGVEKRFLSFPIRPSSAILAKNISKQSPDIVISMFKKIVVIFFTTLF